MEFYSSFYYSIIFMTLIIGALVLSFLSVFHMQQVATAEINNENGDLQIGELVVDGDARFNKIETIGSANFKRVTHNVLEIPTVLTWANDNLTSIGAVQSTNGIFKYVDLPGELGAANFAASFNKNSSSSTFNTVSKFVNFQTRVVEFPDALNNENWAVSTNTELFEIVNIATVAPSALSTTTPNDSTGVIFRGSEIRITDVKLRCFGWVNLRTGATDSPISLSIRVNGQPIATQLSIVGLTFTTLVIDAIIPVVINDTIQLACEYNGVASPTYDISSFGFTCTNN